jgi:hypothetical protein
MPKRNHTFGAVEAKRAVKKRRMMLMPSMKALFRFMIP